MFNFNVAHAQQSTSYPVVGERMPAFEIGNVDYYKNRKIYSDELKGKFVILSCWVKGCVACVAGFPRIDSLQRKYKNKLLIILVGDTLNNIREEYERHRKAYGLQLASAYEPSFHTDEFAPLSKLNSYWINPSGIVQAISASRDINENNVEAFLDGREFEHDDFSVEGLTIARSAYNRQKPLGIGGNGGGSDDVFLYRSFLQEWKQGMGTYERPSYINEMMEIEGVPKFEGVRVVAWNLFHYAYFGRNSIPDSLYHFPIFENEQDNFYKNDNQYNYSLIVPKEKANKQSMMRIMKNELVNYFGFRMRIEERELPCFLLVKKGPKAAFLTNFEDEMRGLTKEERRRKGGSTLLFATEMRLWDIGQGGVKVFDESGLGTLKYFDFGSQIYTKINQLRNILNKFDLDIIPGVRMQKAMVYYKDK
ncbi:hypothetical protein [Chitinophaga sp. MD30]|uniref:TlpA family protein disulfide reductase n=1 Tax=Chitinophaga sp. MD30 TaxID=2033437 RepID=UPI000BB0A60A|nr:hypothetical protein [Chitinophaga sp. MD30]ASZ13893.1 hypothetical protein CK934_24510 [Chitinophaga sp. MD30]